MDLAVGVPVKPFSAAKGRLSDVLDVPRRQALARHLATNTLTTVLAVGFEPVVLSASEAVDEFARALGHKTQLTPTLGLNGAATRFRSELAAERPWLIVHADLPYLTPEALAAAIEALGRSRAVVVPSPDGGTTVIGAHDHRLAFAYGPASFHRHRRQVPTADVIVDFRLSCDLDRPQDLSAARSRVDRLSTLLGP